MKQLIGQTAYFIASYLQYHYIRQSNISITIDPFNSISQPAVSQNISLECQLCTNSTINRKNYCTFRISFLLLYVEGKSSSFYATPAMCYHTCLWCRDILYMNETKASSIVAFQLCQQLVYCDAIQPCQLASQSLFQVNVVHVV